jgi:class 3 adenylate cyclase/DNA-binding beta-propeller fold protein YncE
VTPRTPTRTLATVLFTDIVGSTEHASALEDRRWQELLARHHRIVRRNLKRYSGREIDTAGDGFFATFEQPANGVRCACAISAEVRELGIEIRAGLHTGEVEVARSGVRGVAVHLGSRLMSVASAGEVLVSSTTRDLISGSGITLADHGVHRLKGIEGEQHLFEVTAIDGQPLAPPLDAAEAERRRAAIEPLALTARRGPLIAVAAVAVVLAAIGAFAILGGGETPPSGPGDASTERPPVNAVVGIDPDTFARIALTRDAVVPTGAGNPRMSVGEGALWVRSEAVVAVNLTTFEATQGPQIDTPSLSVTTGDGSVWIPGAKPSGLTVGPGLLFRIDPKSLAELPPIELAHDGIPMDLAFGSDAIWVSFPDGQLERVDPKMAKVDIDVHLEGAIDVVAADADGVWVLDELAGTVRQVDANDGHVLATAAVSSNARLLAAAEGGVWVLDTIAATVTFIDGATGAAHSPLGVGSSPTGIAVGFGAAWVADADGSLYRLDAVTNEVTSTSVGTPLTAVAVDEADGIVWVTTGAAR